MKGEEFKQEALRITLPLVAEPPQRWTTFNVRMHSYLVDDCNPMRSEVQLQLDEAPLFECILEHSCMLITTERVVSIIEDKYDEIRLKEIKGFGNEYVEENYRSQKGEKPPPVNKMVLKGEDDKRLLCIVDSHDPAYFAQMLIKNLISYVECGQWFWPRPWRKPIN
jgi:hypothetical protein